MTPTGTRWPYYVGLGNGDTADILLMTGIGAVAALTLPWVVRGCAAVQAGLAWALLGRPRRRAEPRQ